MNIIVPHVFYPFSLDSSAPLIFRSDLLPPSGGEGRDGNNKRWMLENGKWIICKWHGDHEMAEKEGSIGKAM